MELSKEIEDIISDAIHDVCEECIARHDCKRPCFEVVRMRQLAVDVVKAERERCVNATKSVTCAPCINRKNIDICSVTLCRAKEVIIAIKGENKNERQIESRI